MPTQTSIVIASFSSLAHLERCLDSLQIQAEGEEIIVSTIFSGQDLEALHQRFDLKVVLNPEEAVRETAGLRETRVFRLRSRGVELAQGEIIVLLEDHCEVTPNWLHSMKAALQKPGYIAGGPVSQGEENDLIRSALYWSEYAAMCPPFTDTEQPRYLSAVNSAYRRADLQACRDVWQDGFYDNEVHDALVANGGCLCLAKDAVVFTRLPFSFMQALVHLYTGGRRYGSYRGGGHWSLRRMLRVFATLLVPIVLFVRILKIVRSKKQQSFPRFWLAAPFLLLLLSAWGAGEMVGTASHG